MLTSIKELPLDPVYRFDERKLTSRQIEAIPAGNQVTTFGFACRQNAALMPLPIWLAHKLSRRMAEAAKEKILPYLCPEAKTDVGIEYRDRKPSRIHSITITASQKEAAKPELDKLRADIREAVIEHVFRDEPLRPDDRTEIFINPEGDFSPWRPIGSLRPHREKNRHRYIRRLLQEQRGRSQRKRPASYRQGGRLRRKIRRQEPGGGGTWRTSARCS